VLLPSHNFDHPPCCYYYGLQEAKKYGVWVVPIGKLFIPRFVKIHMVQNLKWTHTQLGGFTSLPCTVLSALLLLSGTIWYDSFSFDLPQRISAQMFQKSSQSRFMSVQNIILFPLNPSSFTLFVYSFTDVIWESRLQPSGMWTSK
jgi:hypothetical protein